MDTAIDTQSRPASAASEVYLALRESIIELALVPGTVLSRIELADQYGVSQTPVRDALMRLETEGLVDVFPQHATRVSAIDLSKAREAHFLRRALELEIIGLLAEKADHALMTDLRGFLSRQKADIDNDDLADFSAADAAMHARMFDAAGVPDLLVLVRSRSGHIDRLRRLHLMTPGKAQRILDDHQRIVDAIAEAAPRRARDAVRQHLSGTLAEAPDIKARFPDYFRD